VLLLVGVPVVVQLLLYASCIYHDGWIAAIHRSLSKTEKIESCSALVRDILVFNSLTVLGIWFWNERSYYQDEDAFGFIT
jgi:hypothetical protein